MYRSVTIQKDHCLYWWLIKMLYIITVIYLPESWALFSVIIFKRHCDSSVVSMSLPTMLPGRRWLMHFLGCRTSPWRNIDILGDCTLFDLSRRTKKMKPCAVWMQLMIKFIFNNVGKEENDEIPFKYVQFSKLFTVYNRISPVTMIDVWGVFYEFKHQDCSTVGIFALCTILWGWGSIRRFCVVSIGIPILF